MSGGILIPWAELLEMLADLPWHLMAAIVAALAMWGIALAAVYGGARAERGAMRTASAATIERQSRQALRRPPQPARRSNVIYLQHLLPAEAEAIRIAARRTAHRDAQHGLADRPNPMPRHSRAAALWAVEYHDARWVRTLPLVPSLNPHA